MVEQVLASSLQLSAMVLGLKVISDLAVPVFVDVHRQLESEIEADSTTRDYRYRDTASVSDTAPLESY